MKAVNLSMNLISGHVVCDLNDKEAMETLDLSCNNLSGIIESESIESLTVVASIDLSFNAYSGTIPDSFQKLGDCLITLNLSGKIKLPDSITTQA